MFATLLFYESLIECELPSKEKICHIANEAQIEIILLDYFVVGVLIMLMLITYLTIPVSLIVLSWVIVLALLGLLLVTCIDLFGGAFASTFAWEDDLNAWRNDLNARRDDLHARWDARLDDLHDDLHAFFQEAPQQEVPLEDVSRDSE